ncbi:MAG: anaerobic ribonucleoside-triphosphate reductase [Alphaproteobacteria bacterium]
MIEIELKDSERTRCEIWTRVMGYHRPVESFNKGKKEEFYSRKCFTEEKAVEHLDGFKMAA